MTDLREVPIDQVVGDPANPRAVVEVDDDFVESIRTHGVLSPPRAVALANGRVQLFAGGHRRLAGAKAAGQMLFPVVITDSAAGDEADRLERMLVENVHRQELDPLDEANAYRRLRELGRDQRDLADRVGRSQSHISKRLSLLVLPDVAKDALVEGRITVQTALGLTGLVKHKPRLARALEVLEAGRDVDGVVRRELSELARARKLRAELTAAGLTDLSDVPAGDARLVQLEPRGPDTPRNRVGAVAFTLDEHGRVSLFANREEHEVLPPVEPDVAPAAAPPVEAVDPMSWPARQQRIPAQREAAWTAVGELAASSGVPTGGWRAADRIAGPLLAMDAWEMDEHEDLAAFLGWVDAPSDGPAEVFLTRVAEMNPPAVIVAYALHRGLQTLTQARDVQLPALGVLLDLLEAHGYTPLPEERALAGVEAASPDASSRASTPAEDAPDVASVQADVAPPTEPRVSYDGTEEPWVNYTTLSVAEIIEELEYVSTPDDWAARALAWEEAHDARPEIIDTCRRLLGILEGSNA